MISDREATDALLGYYIGPETKNDAISVFVNHAHPLFGRLIGGILQTPSGANISDTSFLGYLPLLLICLGLLRNSTRRQMLPWSILCGAFLILRLGSSLNINGVAYPEILLPKHYLNQLSAGVFKAYWVTDQFMAGAILPLAILACFGLLALQKRTPVAAKPAVILALVIIVAFEYYIPIRSHIVPQERFAYVEWLKTDEEKGKIRLINLPIGKGRARQYGWYQTFNGYPHVDGAISRLPDSAFNYIRANTLLNAWHNRRPITCDQAERDTYLTGLAQLEEDGFSHIVSHGRWYHAQYFAPSFQNVTPAYLDEFVAVFRLDDLGESCPKEFSESHPFTLTYVDALMKNSTIANENGKIIVFPPNPLAGDRFLHFLRHVGPVEKTVVTIASDEQSNIIFQSTDTIDSESEINLANESALWLLNDSREFSAEQTEAYQQWFLARYQLCQRFHEDAHTTIDLYVKADMPCGAMDDSSALNVLYDDGLRLRNVSYDLSGDKLRFYLAWTNNTNTAYAFSLQFFDEEGRKVLQYDNVIRRQLLAAHEIDTTPLPEGAYSVRLIVYDYETRVSQGGTLTSTGERFERELEIAKTELQR